MNKTRILVVEDEILVARDLQSSLELLGYDVPEIAITGAEALEKIAATQPDVVLMDIHLKGDMDGVEAAGIVREQYDIALIYLTAYADDNTLQHAKLTQPYGYLLKPYQETELKTTIEVALYKHETAGKLKVAHQQLERAHAQIRLQVRELQARDQLVRFQVTGPTVDEACDQIARIFSTVFGATQIGVYLPDASGTWLELTSTAGDGTDTTDRLVASDPDSLVAGSFRDVAARLSADGRQAAVAMHYSDRAVGVVGLGAVDQEGWPSSELIPALHRLGEQSALLLRMARVATELDGGQLTAEELLELEEEATYDDGA